jgi:hypothetical protein
MDLQEAIRGSKGSVVTNTAMIADLFNVAMPRSVADIILELMLQVSQSDVRRGVVPFHNILAQHVPDGNNLWYIEPFGDINGDIGIGVAHLTNEIGTYVELFPCDDNGYYLGFIQSARPERVVVPETNCPLIMDPDIAFEFILLMNPNARCDKCDEDDQG